MSHYSQARSAALSAPKRCVVYCRVSSAGQEDNSSLQSQEDDGRAYAAERGWTVVRVYNEVHTGRDLFERPQLTLLREAMRRREFDVLVVWALDRLSRKQTHQGLILSEAEYAGVEWDSVTEDIDNSPQGQILRAVIGGMAEIERAKIAERTSRGRRARAESGKPMPGPRPPYGYQWMDASKTKLVVDPKTGPIVQRLFAEACIGRPLRSIAAGLTADGISTPTGQLRWCASTVQGLLKRVEYTGNATAFRTRMERKNGKIKNHTRPTTEQIELPAGTFPALVKREVFEAVGARLEKNRSESTRNNPNPEATLLRAGFVRCGYCGNAMVVQRSKLAGELYACSSRSRDVHGCPYFSIKASILDAAVWERVESVIRQPDVVAREIERQIDRNPIGPDIGAVDRRLAEVAKGQSRLSQAIASVDDEDAIEPLIAQLKVLGAQRRELEAERAVLEASKRDWEAAQDQLADLAIWCGKVGERLTLLTYEEKRNLLSALALEAKVYQRTHEPRYEIVMRLDDIVSSSS